MRKAEVSVGRTYVAKVSGKITKVKLVSESLHGGWDAVNVETGRRVRIRTAARLRKEVQANVINPARGFVKKLDVEHAERLSLSCFDGAPQSKNP